MHDRQYEGHYLPEPETTTLNGTRVGMVLDKALRMFGDVGKRYIMDNLVSHGIKFDKDSRYSLEQVQKVLSGIGEEASLVIDRVRKEMDLAYAFMTFLDASLMSSGLIVFLPAWMESSTACLDILSAASSSTLRSSSAASSLTLSAPDFFIMRCMAARPNSGPEDITCRSAPGD